MKTKRTFTVVLTQDEENPKVLNVTVPSLPGCLTFGFGRRDALKNAKEAIELYLETTEDDGVQIVNAEATEIEVAA